MTKRESYKQKISYDKGVLMPGTKTTVWVGRGQAYGRGGRGRGVCYHASHDGIAVPGFYADAETAVLVARTWPTKAIIEKLGPIYSPAGLGRPVTLGDVLARTP